MHYFSTLFWRELCMFRTGLLSITRSLNTVFTAIVICHTSYIDCLLEDSQQRSSLQNKVKKQCILFAFIIRGHLKVKDSSLPTHTLRSTVLLAPLVSACVSEAVTTAGVAAAVVIMLLRPISLTFSTSTSSSLLASSQIMEPSSLY